MIGKKRSAHPTPPLLLGGTGGLMAAAVDEDALSLGIGPLVPHPANDRPTEPASTGSATVGAWAHCAIHGADALSASTGSGADGLDGSDDKNGKLDDARSRPWNDDEDATVRSLVDIHGTKCWSLIADSLCVHQNKFSRARVERDEDVV